jgi:DNA polymerase/3'-5' exonuclease PolX
LDCLSRGCIKFYARPIYPVSAVASTGPKRGPSLVRAQLLSTQKENPYKVKAYHRAAAKIRSLSESLDELVREEADLTQFPGIGDAIASAIREIVLTGTLRKLDTLRGQAAPEVASLADYPRLDPKRVLRIYKGRDHLRLLFSAGLRG